MVALLLVLLLDHSPQSAHAEVVVEVVVVFGSHSDHAGVVVVVVVVVLGSHSVHAAVVVVVVVVFLTGSTEEDHSPQLSELVAATTAARPRVAMTECILAEIWY